MSDITDLDGDGWPDDVADDDPVPSGLDQSDLGIDQDDLEASPVEPVDYTDACCPTERPTSELPGAGEWAPNGNLVLATAEGSTDFGPPTLDLDGNGVPDATVVPGEDGSAYLLMDVTGDNFVDGAMLVDAQGVVLTAFAIDEQGQVVPVEGVAGSTVDEVLSGAQPDQAPADQVVPETAEEPIVDPLEPAADGQGAPGSRVVLTMGTQVIDLGPPTLDLSNDGTLDAVVVPDEQGRPAYVVAELSATGESDYVAVLDPDTGELMQEYGYHDGERVDLGQPGDMEIVPGEAPAEEVTPAPQAAPGAEEAAVTPTTGPERIVAPGAESANNPMLAMTYQMSQRQYDIASELWFQLTGGEPYPRNEQGQPYGPAMVLSMLVDRPDVSDEYDDELKSMIASINGGIAAWTQPSNG
jgi:hypothetical protein